MKNGFKIQSNFKGSYIQCSNGLFSYMGEWANSILGIFIKLDIVNDYDKKILVLRDIVIPKTNGLVIYGEIK